MPPRRIQARRAVPQRPDAGASLSKIKEEISIAAKELGSLTSDRDALKNDIYKLHNEKSILHHDISQARLALDDLRSQTHRTSQAHVTLDADHATKKAAYAADVRDLEAQITRLNEELVALEPFRKEITTLQSIKATLTEELDHLEKNITFIREERRVEDESMEAKREEIRDEIATLNDLIGKNGRIAYGIEQDRAKLEIYIRRLQRYYDETGVQLNILSEFNLTPYGDSK